MGQKNRDHSEGAPQEDSEVAARADSEVVARADLVAARAEFAARQKAFSKVTLAGLLLCAVVQFCCRAWQKCVLS